MKIGKGRYLLRTNLTENDAALSGLPEGASVGSSRPGFRATPYPLQRRIGASHSINPPGS